MARAHNTTARPWSPSDDAALRALVAKRVPCVEIARRLGRTRSAVENRRHIIGARIFRRRPAGRAERITELLTADPTRTDTAIAAEVGGVSRATVARARAALGLPALTRRAWAAVAARTCAARRALKSNEPTRAEARALTALACGPASPIELAARIGVSQGAVYQVLFRLRAKCLAFAEGRSGRSGTTWYALSWWLVHNDGLVWSAANRIRRKNPWCEPDDLAGELRLDIANCVKTFRPKGFKFSTYALRAAERNVLCWAALQRTRGVYVPHLKRFDRGACGEVGDLTVYDPVAGEYQELPVPARAGDDAPPMDPAFWEKAVAGLAPVPAAIVLGHYRDGLGYTELGRTVLGGRSRERVRQIIDKALDEIRRTRALAEHAPCAGVI